MGKRHAWVNAERQNKVWLMQCMSHALEGIAGEAAAETAASFAVSRDTGRQQVLGPGRARSVQFSCA